MVTIYNVKKVSGDKENPRFLVDVRCLSSDDKPTVYKNGVIENGSQLVEINTGDLYLYDGVSKEWMGI